jgi:hypothetical protein
VARLDRQDRRRCGRVEQVVEQSHQVAGIEDDLDRVGLLG